MKKILDIFVRFLGLGFISFGGPAAHIGYFRKLFVEKLGWENEESYARLIALSQFLPGPGSSQVGFAVGLRRAGLLGGIAAFVAFTLPSFMLLYFLATLNVSHLDGSDTIWTSLFKGVIQGLKWMAVVVVSDAVLKMYGSFCKTRGAVTIAFVVAAVSLLVPSIQVQLGLLILAALLGIFFPKSWSMGSTSLRSANISNSAVTSPKIGQMGIAALFPLILFVALFMGLPFLLGENSSIPWMQELGLFSDFYQAGSLVFGGGHVVLPMLQQVLGESIGADRFLLGYAAAQAIPGPMFAFATFLGAELSLSYSTMTPFIGALIATLGIFLPGFLLVLGLQGIWESLAEKPRIAGATWGINAAVVGLLLSAWYQPVWTSAVGKPMDMAWIFLGFVALRTWKVPVVWLVLGFGVLGALVG